MASQLRQRKSLANLHGACLGAIHALLHVLIGNAPHGAA
jgi:hypothetical protein